MPANTANEETFCRWNAVTDACDVGYGALADLFGDKSSNKNAQFVSKFAVGPRLLDSYAKRMCLQACLTATDGETCAAITDCIWDTFGYLKLMML